MMMQILLGHPVPAPVGVLRACGGHGREIPSSPLPLSLLRLPLLSDVHKNIPSSLFGRSTRRRDCTPTPTASPAAGGAARSPSALKLIRSCDSGAKRANVKTCLLRFYFGYCSSYRRSSLPSFEHPSLLPFSPLSSIRSFPRPKKPS